MTGPTVPRVSVASGALGTLAVATGFRFGYNYGPPASRFSGPNTGLAIFFIAPIAAVGGVLLAHAIYRYLQPADRAPWWLAVYPLASAGVIALVGVYIVLVTESIPYESVLDLVVPAAVAGVVVAGAVWSTDLARSRSASRER